MSPRRDTRLHPVGLNVPSSCLSWAWPCSLRALTFSDSTFFSLPGLNRWGSPEARRCLFLGGGHALALPRPGVHAAVPAAAGPCAFFALFPGELASLVCASCFLPSLPPCLAGHQPTGLFPECVGTPARLPSLWARLRRQPWGRRQGPPAHPLALGAPRLPGPSGLKAASLTVPTAASGV